ncbi:BamA/TamA family outer membrane protein [Kaistella sp. PBT33-4]|uniref:translocation and assembly module lipoprotein TamL n=1 Tax=Kaistella sp. PBT33-4 TaxID=3032000 RepID=UPI0023D8C318|nr:BamA/TamA family outer membrane protein [Kaistella sp. PBT33-4]MDF0720294.1 BamA/TamA family outer membrane protein [Kaistella sp. PBT33-4]
MSRNHSGKYLQKYHIFLSSATVVLFLYACSTTRKVPDGEYLLTKNNFRYDGPEVLANELPDYVTQKPNKKQLLFFPAGLWMYNLSDPKYDTILNEYMTYPSDMRDQKLRDSLFIKYGHPEYVGRNLFMNRFFHNVGQPPVILDPSKSESSANSIRKRLVYRGYWDAETAYSHDLDSAAKKAQVNYLITPKDATKISEYYYDIPDARIKSIYEENLTASTIRSRTTLDQEKLEAEVKRINDLMRSRGYYQFNSSGQEIFFMADTLSSRKNVPVTMEIHKDSLDTPYKTATIGNIDVAVVENANDFPQNTVKDSLRGIRFHMLDDQFKSSALWRAVILRNGDLYDQKNLDLTRRNFQAMNNFSLIKARDSLRRGGTAAPNDSIVDVLYLLKPLPKYELKVAADLNYSQLLNLAASPSVDLTTRNLFGGAENLNTSVSWIAGRVRNSKDLDTRVWAHEFSANANLSFPRLLLPFSYYKLIPKRYSPSTSVSLGASFQKNIGMDRVNFNTGLNYFANVNDVISHRLTIFNTQLSLTRNKDRYYEYFPRDGDVRNFVFQKYSPSLYTQFEQGEISSDEFSAIILNDQAFVNSLSPDELNTYNTFRQSLVNKDRQTQDVLISSFIYNFIYNEIGKKEFENPFYFNGKVEVAGNLLSLVAGTEAEKGITTGQQKTLFKLPLSQFVKFDIDVRKYLTFGKQTLAMRQFVGLGVPYGNSNQMPFVRSYFNGGSNDIRAWRPFGGLGPADSQLDERIRTFVMGNVKLTSSVEYRLPLTEMYEVAVFTDAGNIWSLKNTGFGDQFKFSKFLKQMGVGSGLGLRINVAYITARIDLAYKIYDPNKPEGDRWRFNKIQPLKPTLNFAFGYPF